MTLLSALPTELEHIAQMYLQVTAIADFKLTEIQEGILAEHSQKQNKGGSEQIQKLSNVKCKGDNPKWKPHVNRQNDQKGDWSSRKQCGKKSGQSQKEKQQSNQQKPAQHSHMASQAEISQPLRSLTFVNGCGFIIKPSTAHIE